MDHHLIRGWRSVKFVSLIEWVLARRTVSRMKLIDVDWLEGVELSSTFQVRFT